MKSVCFVKKNAKPCDLDNFTRCLRMFYNITISGYAISFFENTDEAKNSIFEFYDIPDHLDCTILCFLITPKSPDDFAFMVENHFKDIRQIPLRKEYR